MVWVESIANPMMVVADIPSIVDGAHSRGAIVVVDATFATPLRQRPLAMGADIVMHSATKFIGGHSDLLLGAAICRDPAHAAALSAYRHDHGAIPGSLEAFLALRGLRTLGVRLDRSEATAAELARRLDHHPGVVRVHYAGLPHDPNFERARRVLPDGCGAMLAFEVAGTVEQTDAFLTDLRLLTHATSLGGVESLIERRSRYAGDAEIAGATLCRLSVGVEHVDDLWGDIDRSLRNALGLG
jgi:cystathionine gamma-synthase